MIQYALMCGKLSSSSRATASIFRSSTPVVPGQLASSVFCGMEGQRDERLEAARLVLQLAQAQQVVHPLLQRLHVAVEHGGVGGDAQRWAVSCTSSHCSPEIFLRGRPAPRTLAAKISAPPPGMRVEPGRLQLRAAPPPRSCRRSAAKRTISDAVNALQVDVGAPGLERARSCPDSTRTAGRGALRPRCAARVIRRGGEAAALASTSSRVMV